MITSKLRNAVISGFFILNIVWFFGSYTATRIAAGSARCAERGMQKSGVEWKWGGGNTCWLPGTALPPPAADRNRTI